MADKGASELATEDNGHTFPLFNRLPWEIRHGIWEQALPSPTPQVLVYKPSTFSAWDPTTNTWDTTDGPPRVPIPPPALLHATHESRKFVLENVVVREERHNGLYPHKRHRVVSRPFDRETDALYIHRENFDAFMEVYMATTPWAARHLVFDILIYQIRHRFPEYWAYCWDDFDSAVDSLGCYLRSIALSALYRCDLLLSHEAIHDGVVKGYYRTVPDGVATAWREDYCERLAAEFRDHQGPNGALWKVRVGSGNLRGADGGEDDEELLECSQVVLKRFTASTMDQD